MPDLEEALKIFKVEGFNAIKFHYGKIKQSQVRITLSENEKYFTLTYLE